MGYKLTWMYIWTNKVRPSVTPPWQPDASRTLLYLQLNNNVDDSSWNSVSVSSSEINYGTAWNNHYAQLTSTSWSIQPTATIWQQIGTWDFTVSFFFYGVDTSWGDMAWLFGNWDNSNNPRPWICIRFGWGDGNYILWADDWNWNHQYYMLCPINMWHHQVYIRKNGVCSCYLDWQYVWGHTSTIDLASPWVNVFYILNRDLTQSWRNTWARISEVIFEKVAWTEDDITWYFNYQKWNYWIS